MQVQRNPLVEEAPMKYETVLFNPENNKFCVLNITAALLWQQLETPKSEGDLLGAVQDNFSGVDIDTATDDIKQVLSDLFDVECVISAE